MSSILMRRALEYSRMFDVPIITHSEDLELTDDGIMNEGKNSTLLGLKGIPRESEEVMIARDVHPHPAGRGPPPCRPCLLRRLG